MDRNGADAMSNTPEQFATLIKSEVGKYGAITKRLGIKLD
jgi:tripartite-type tricarboxylate transporter receptor subunit TctC